MDGKLQPYLHSLLFRCEQCKEPIPISAMSAERNLEKIDGDSFDVQCKCGRSKQLLGLEAVRHYVIPWEDAQNLVELDTARQQRLTQHHGDQ
jgi:hypothetical protein